MMPSKGQKRKRTLTDGSNPGVRKKSKTKGPQSESSAASEAIEWWQVRAIVKERKRRGRIQYLVDWEPDPVTGEPYEKEWKYRKDVTKDAIEEWEDLQLAKEEQPQQFQQAPESRDSSSRNDESEANNHPNYVLKKAPRQGRKRRVINSSSQPERTPPNLCQQSLPAVEEILRAPISSAESSPLFDPTSSFDSQEIEARPVAQVHVTIKDDFLRDSYLPGLTQALPFTLPEPFSSAAEQIRVPAAFGPRVVIPDSQSLPAESSFDTSPAAVRSAESKSPRISTQILPASRVQEVCPHIFLPSQTPDNSNTCSLLSVTKMYDFY